MKGLNHGERIPIWDCSHLWTSQRKDKIWRWMQSAANPSLVKIPVNREKYREFWPLSGPGCVYRRVNTGERGFWFEIVTGN
jgi:hypothetical protein